MGKVICLPCCLILLACLIDSGDGQWKRLKLNELKRDVFLLEKLADNLEHEIEDFYDEKLPARHHAEPHAQHHHSKRKHKTRTKKLHTTPAVPNVTADLNKSSIGVYKKPNRTLLKGSSEELSKKINISDLHWPKFEEILSMNRRKYDWKNDRWIKLNSVPRVESKKVEMHKSKHRFNYRRVRLNSGKAKGNVVIAVSAVRKKDTNQIQ